MSGSRRGGGEARRRLPGVVALVVLLAGATACGDRDGAVDPAPGETGPRELVAVGTVADCGEGPRLWVGATTDVGGDPAPGCAGPRVAGWSWDGLAHEARDGVRWGSYAVIGTWDGEVLTQSREPVPADRYDAPARETPPEPERTSCPEPDGGWRPGVADDDGFWRAASLAERLRAVNRTWVDQGMPDDIDSLPAEEQNRLVGAPPRQVLNVLVVGGEPERAEVERRLRAVWDGDLCVVAGATYSQGQVRRVARELRDRDDLEWLSLGEGDGRVTLEVFHDDGALQAELDETYGDGMVEVGSALRPVG